jgi:hypothetical protein
VSRIAVIPVMHEGVGAVQRGAQQHISSSVHSRDSSFFSGISHGVLFGLGMGPVTTGIADLQRQPWRFYPLSRQSKGSVFWSHVFFTVGSRAYYMIYPKSRLNTNQSIYNSHFVHCAIPLSVPYPRPSPLLIKHKEHSPSAPPRLTILRALGGPPRLRVSAKFTAPMPEYSHHSPHTATKAAVNGTENLACGGEGTVVPRAKGAMRSAAEKGFFCAHE